MQIRSRGNTCVRCLTGGGTYIHVDRRQLLVKKTFLTLVLAERAGLDRPARLDKARPEAAWDRRTAPWERTRAAARPIAV